MPNSGNFKLFFLFLNNGKSLLAFGHHGNHFGKEGKINFKNAMFA